MTLHMGFKARVYSLSSILFSHLCAVIPRITSDQARTQTGNFLHVWRDVWRDVWREW